MEDGLRAHDDDPRVPVLVNRRGHERPVFQRRFSGTPFDCSFVLSVLLQTSGKRTSKSLRLAGNRQGRNRVIESPESAPWWPRLSDQGGQLAAALSVDRSDDACGRKDPELKRFYHRKLIPKGMGKARIAAAYKLGIRLWIMLRDQIDYTEFCRRGQRRQRGEAHAGMPNYTNGPASQ